MKRQTISTDEKFDEYVKTLHDDNPDISKAMCIRLAIKYCALNHIDFFNMSRPVDIVTPMAVQARKEKVPKEDWCRSFGGEVKDGVCQIYKYETLITGHVSKQFRTIPISAFPMDRDEFRKSVIGHYDTLEDADAAWKNKPID